MPETFNLPFDLTAESVGDWLTSIDQLSHSEKVNLLNGMLNELYNAPIEAGVLFPVLDKLTVTVLMLSKLIENMAMKENCPPDKVRKWMSVAIQLPKKLGFTYARLANDDSMAQLERRLCIYRAAQILCLLNKRTALLYEAPDLSLWKKLAELYVCAEASETLTIKMEDSVPGLISYPTIQAAFRHVLLFYGCHVQQCLSSDISSVFSVTAELTPLVRLEHETSDFTLCCWNPDHTLPPFSASQENVNEHTLYLNIQPLLDYFDNHVEKLEKFKAFPAVINRLMLYQDIRRSVNPVNPKKCGLIIGPDQAAKFLNTLISRYRILELSGAIQEKREPGKLELVPFEAENKAKASLSTKILNDDKSFSAAQLNAYETAHPAFFLAKIGNLDCSLDEPVILVEEEQPPFFAIIRHLRIETNARLKNLLLEKIDGAVYPVEIGDLQGFIIIRSSSETSELFLPSGVYYNNGTVLNAAKGIVNKSFRIEKFIEMSAYFTRYEIDFC